MLTASDPVPSKYQQHLNLISNLITGLTSGLFDLVVGLAFSVYLLSGKERLLAQVKKLQKAFMKPEQAVRLNTV